MIASNGTTQARAFTRKLGLFALADGVSAGEGRGIAEQWAAGQNAGHLHRHDADKWRQLEATEGQLAMLRRQGIAIPVQGFTRGHASDLSVATEAYRCTSTWRTSAARRGVRRWVDNPTAPRKRAKCWVGIWAR